MFTPLLCRPPLAIQRVFLLIYAADPTGMHVLLQMQHATDATPSLSPEWVLPHVPAASISIRDITAGRTAEELALGVCINELFTKQDLHLVRSAQRRVSPVKQRMTPFGRSRRRGAPPAQEIVTRYVIMNVSEKRP